MQPTFLIDWLRQLHLNADSALAEKRWKLALNFAQKATRMDAIHMLRSFLFAEVPAENAHQLTLKLKAMDNEFPGDNNLEEIRLMSGVFGVAAKDANVALADAFALGVTAAAFPAHRSNPAHQGICEEMAKYLNSKSESLRSGKFASSDDCGTLAGKLMTLFSVTPGESAVANKAASEIASSFDEIYGLRIQRLAEETTILWWLLGGYSDGLKLDRSEISGEAYALVAASEMSARTQLLPPPPSIYAILDRALAQCKGSKKKKTTLRNVISVTDDNWRNKFVTEHQATDCADLVPLFTAVSKVADAADISALGKPFQKACPGVSPDLAISEIEAATQLFNELVFVRALAKLG